MWEREDHPDTFDDWDPLDWEEHMFHYGESGWNPDFWRDPDPPSDTDYVFEPEEDEVDLPDDDDAEDESCKEERNELMANQNTYPDRSAIVRLLHASEIGTLFQVPGGFSVPRGVLVRLESGEVLDAYDWLLRNGFEEAQIIDGWHVRQLPGIGQEVSRFVFCRNPIAIQASSATETLPENGGGEEYGDDDIPF